MGQTRGDGDGKSWRPGVRIQMDDGALSVPDKFASPLCEEYQARGGMSVAQAQTLVEKWGKPVRDRA